MPDENINDSLEETYLQISPNILESFPKYHPPVDLYAFDPELAQVKKLQNAKERLTRERQQDVVRIASDGRLFLLREDYAVYAQHLSKRLGLLLVEDGFNALEVAEIFFLAFRARVEDFFEQPKEPALKALLADVSVLAEYIWTDPGRIAFLTRTLDREYSLDVHSVNTMFIGLAIFTAVTGGRFERADLVNMALGLILHDLGMTRVPRFVVDKQQFLVRRDRESIENHIEAGLKMLKRLKLDDPILRECVSQHHERLDGSGYPERRFAESISLHGRICALADTFSAMIAERPYKDAKKVADALASLTHEPGKYDGELVRLLAAQMAECGTLDSCVV